MRDDQESKALVIENKRRVAKGLEPLENLADAEQDEQGIDGDNETANSSPEGADETVTDPDPRDSEDVLLMETGRILVDAITLRPNTSVAGRTQ
jgi:carboxyl-terminal processing protease